MRVDSDAREIQSINSNNYPSRLLPQTASFSSTVLSYLVVLGLGFAGFKYAQKKGVIVLENLAHGASDMRTRSREDSLDEPMETERKKPRKPRARATKN